MIKEPVQIQFFADVLAARARSILAVLVAGLSLCWTTSALADASSVVGLWLTEKEKVTVEIFECSDELCGRLAWLKKPFDKTGRLRRDRENPNPSLRNRPWCGMTVITGLQESGHRKWGNGKFYYPSHGRSYDIELRREGERLKVRAFLGLKLAGKSETWRRAPPNLHGCPAT